MRHPLFASAALLATTSLANTHVVDIQWSGDGRFAHQLTVAAGKFVEVCGTLPAGLQVRWDFQAGAPLDFNVHYHVGQEVWFPARLSAVATAGDKLDVKIEQDYCWKWTNKSAQTTALRVELRR